MSDADIQLQKLAQKLEERITLEESMFRGHLFDCEKHRPGRHASTGVDAVEDTPCPRCGELPVVQGYDSSTDSGSLVRCTACGFQTEPDSLADMEILRLRIKILRLENNS